MNLNMTPLSRRTLLAAPLLSFAASTTPKPYGALPSERQLRWHELEFYTFLHFTTNTYTLDGHGAVPNQLEVYEYTGPYTYLARDRGDKLAKIKVEAWESQRSGSVYES